MKEYVIAFVFSSDFEHVLLIHKNRPEWQKGLLNGLGGKVEAGETTHICVHREVKEECGLNIHEEKWIKSGKIHSPSFTADVFGALYDGEMSDAKTLEDEPVEWFKVNELPSNVIENMPWLMHITLDKIKNNHFETFDVVYKK